MSLSFEHPGSGLLSFCFTNLLFQTRSQNKNVSSKISFVFMFAVMLSCLCVWKFGEGALIVWCATYVGDNLFVGMTTLIVFMCFLFSIT